MNLKLHTTNLLLSISRLYSKPHKPSKLNIPYSHRVYMNPTLDHALKNPERMAECEVCKKEIPTHKGFWVGYNNEYFLCSSECEDNF